MSAWRIVVTVAQPKILLPIDETSGTTLTNFGSLASADYTISGGTESTHFSHVSNANSTLSYLDVFTTAVYITATSAGAGPSTAVEAINCACKFALASLVGGTRRLWGTPGDKILMYATSPTVGGDYDLHIEVTSNFSTTAQKVISELAFGTAYRVCWVYDPSTPSAAYIRSKLDSAAVSSGSTVDHNGHNLTDNSAQPSLLSTSGGYAPTQWFYMVYGKGDTIWSSADQDDINTDPVSAITGWPSSAIAYLPIYSHHENVLLRR